MGIYRANPQKNFGILMVQKSGFHQLMLVVLSHCLWWVLYIPGYAGFLNHQQYFGLLTRLYSGMSISYPLPHGRFPLFPDLAISKKRVCVSKRPPKIHQTVPKCPIGLECLPTFIYHKLKWNVGKSTIHPRISGTQNEGPEPYNRQFFGVGFPLHKP